MCDCLTEGAEKVLAHLQESHDDKEVVTKGTGYTHLVLQLTGKSLWRSYQEFEYKAQRKKVDGTLGKEQTKKISVHHSYCPFCGEPFPKEGS